MAIDLADERPRDDAGPIVGYLNNLLVMAVSKGCVPEDHPVSALLDAFSSPGPERSLRRAAVVEVRPVVGQFREALGWNSRPQCAQLQAELHQLYKDLEHQDFVAG